MSNFALKSLSESSVVVTGGSRDIGGGIVLELAKAGAKVVAVFRTHVERAQKIVEEAKKTGNEPILVQADLITSEGKERVFESWKELFADKIDVLVLCASGATMEINVDANMALVDKFLEIRRERLNEGEKLSLGTIIFLQSEPGHYQRVIDGVFDFFDYYRDKVGPAKRAGEDALRERLNKMSEVGVRGVVVCPPEVEDTFNMKLFELQNKEARSKSRELSAKLGSKPFVKIVQVAERIHALIEDKEILNGHIELFGNVEDGLVELSKIYGDEAIYVHTFEKTGKGEGVGRIIVNPKLWKRDEEPSFVGRIDNRDKEHLTSTLKVSKDHMRGHFRQDIASIFPGHKSIRTAAVALGRFLESDGSVDEERVYLKGYKSVKFRSPVLPGQTLATKVKLVEKGENKVIGDAFQSVNHEKESMDIRGMQVAKIKDASEAGALLLDQLVEVSAQTVGMYLLEAHKNEEVLPLFHSTGEAEILKPVKLGDNLLIKATNIKIVKTSSMNIFSADLEIYQRIAETITEEPVAKIKGVQGLLLPKNEALKKLT